MVYNEQMDAIGVGSSNGKMYFINLKDLDEIGIYVNDCQSNSAVEYMSMNDNGNDLSVVFI